MDRIADPAPRPLFSLWAWAVLAPFLVTAYGGFDEADTDLQRWLGFGIALLTHLALGLAFIAAAAIERRIRSRWGWIAFVAAAIAVMSVLRPSLATALQLLVGVPPVPTEWWVRFLMNYVLLSGAIVVIGLWLRASDRRARGRERLRRVLRGRTEDIRAAEFATDRVVTEFTDAVAAPVLAALEGVRARPAEAGEQAERLRLVAHEVVRPLSHHVFDAAAPGSGPDSADTPTVAIERATRPRPTLLPERIVPAPIWLPIVAFLAITGPSVVHEYGAGPGALRLAVAAAIALVLNALVARIPLRRGWTALVLHGAAHLAVGAALAWVYLDRSWLPLPAPAASTTTVLWLYLPIGYATIAVLCSLAYSLLADAQGTERTLTRALAFAETAAAESQERYEQTANDIARILHNHVQGDILATSLQLRMGVADENAIDELIANVDRTLHEPATQRAVERSAQEVRDAANAAIVSWSRVMDVTSEAADPECWRWLARHPEATELFLDANTEALTNASQHAAAPAADLRLERIPGGVRMLARNPGRLGPRASDGIGMSDLRRRGATVDLRQEDPGTVLLTIDIVATEDDPA